MTVTDSLLTAEQFHDLGDLGRPAELVRGTIVMMNVPYPRHGQVCNRVAFLVTAYADAHGLGHVVNNDSGVIVERNPDTVRGADVAFYRYETLPRGPLPQGYLSVMPDVVFEVHSPSDRVSDLLEKAAEYLRAGVGAVCLVDPGAETVTVLTERGPARQLSGEDRLELRPWLAEFSVEVRRFFE